MLHNGLYEQIINKGLDTELSVTDKILHWLSFATVLLSGN